MPARPVCLCKGCSILADPLLGCHEDILKGPARIFSEIARCKDLAAKRWMSCLVVSNGFRFQDRSLQNLRTEDASWVCVDTLQESSVQLTTEAPALTWHLQTVSTAAVAEQRVRERTRAEPSLARADKPGPRDAAQGAGLLQHPLDPSC